MFCHWKNIFPVFTCVTRLFFCCSLKCVNNFLTCSRGVEENLKLIFCVFFNLETSEIRSIIFSCTAEEQKQWKRFSDENSLWGFISSAVRGARWLTRLAGSFVSKFYLVQIPPHTQPSWKVLFERIFVQVCKVLWRLEWACVHLWCGGEEVFGI